MRRRRRSTYWGAGGILLGLLAGAPAVAVEPSQQQEPAQHAQEEHGGQEHEEHSHPNEVVLLLGVTHEAEGGENFFTIGGEYGRLLTPRIAVTAAFEHISDIDAWVFAFPVGFALYEGWFVTFGPGFEAVSRRREAVEELEEALEEGHHVEGDEVHAALTTTGSDNNFLLRFGSGYKFELGSRYALMAGFALLLARPGHMKTSNRSSSDSALLC